MDFGAAVKAFDTISPERLQEELSLLAVDPSIVLWITDLLNNRRQYM